MTILAPEYPCLSPESALPATIDERLIVGEIEREMHHRRSAYPRHVAKGQKSPEEAEHEIDLMAAIHADLATLLLLDRWYLSRSVDHARELDEAQRRAADRIAPCGWSALVACLRREIDLRRRYYPRWIAAGSLQADDARRQLERIEAAHFLYWVRARHFWPDELGAWRDPDTCTGGAWPRALHDAWADHYRAHRARFLPAYGNGRGIYQRAPIAPAEQQRELAV